MKHSLTSLFVLTALSVPVPAAQSLVIDLNTNPDPNQFGGDSSPKRLTSTTIGTLFAATDDYGSELWITDGTEAGTSRVKDLWPGQGSGEPQEFVELANGTVVFIAQSGAAGAELWRTDGTEAGTYMVADLYPGPTGSWPAELCALDNQAFFYAPSIVDGLLQGVELWRSDGTAAGTSMLVDLHPGPDSTSYASGGRIAASGDRLFFTATNAESDGWDLWTSDGTPEGSALVVPLTDGLGTRPGRLLPAPGGILFDCWVNLPGTVDLGYELWFSDGTDIVLVADLAPGPASSTPLLLVTDGAVGFFTANVSGLGRELYRSDGTPAGTFLLADVWPGSVSSEPEPLGLSGSRLHFAATTSAQGREPWVTDGTPAGTFPLADIMPGPGSSVPREGAAAAHGRFYFRARGQAEDDEVWSTDGTPAGTGLVADVQAGLTGSAPGDFAPSGAGVVFRADDGISGKELWFTDGTPASTELVLDLAVQVFGTQSSFPELRGRVVDRLVFVADGGTGSARELWATDGTPAGTELLREFGPGTLGVGSAALHGSVVFGDRLHLWTVDWAASTWAQWRTDGTPEGTEFVTTEGAGSPGNFAVFQDRIFYNPVDDAFGRELWVTDGSATGPQLLVDLRPGPLGSEPRNLYTWGDRLYFSADVGAGREPFVTDGTPEGTLGLGDLHPSGNGFWAQSGYGGFGDHVYFAADDGVHGAELWRTDGTAAGTQMFADLNPGSGWSQPDGFTEVGGRMVFRVRLSNDRDLWVSDGTEAGTELLAGFSNGFDPGFGVTQGPIGLADDLAVFLVDDGFSKAVLWRTDGTPGGTQAFLDVDSVGGSGQTFQKADLGSGPVAVLQLNDGLHGREVWATDGTVDGTFLVADIATGPSGSSPGPFERLGDRIVFPGTTDAHGRELHSLPLTATGDWLAQPFGHGCAGTGALTPRIGSSGTATVGDTLAIELDDAPAGAPAFLLAGLDLLLAELGPCTLYVPPVTLVPLTADGTGSATLPLTPTPDLLGVHVATQFLVADPQGTFSGVATLTNALELVIGE